MAAEDFGQHLDRNVPVQSRVVGAVDDAHATLAGFLCDLVMAERLADHGETSTGTARTAI
jgi:hypothetical protein